MPRRTPRHRNLLTHLAAAVVVPGCIALCWWQVARAVSGNTLSWAYVFEWPIFAGYAVYMWWKLIHEGAPGARSEKDPGPVAGGRSDDDDTVAGAGADTPGDGPVAGDGGDSAEDEELASYNRYLAALHASGRRKHW